MHSDVRNANVIRDSLQAIEQLSRLARISLDLQSTHTFRHACQELMSFLNEPIYPQEVVQSSIMSCLQLSTDNVTIDQLDVASKTLNVAIDKIQSVSAHSTLQTWSRRLQSLKSEHDSKQISNRATLDWMRHADHALGPIKLRSGQTSMHWPFFVGANTFGRLHTNIMPSNPPPTSALLQLLIIRTSGLERNQTSCPPTLTVMLNGVTLKFGAKTHNSVKAKSANINFAITGDGVMDISRLIVKGKNVLLVKRDSKAIEEVNLSVETYIVENQETVSARAKEHCIPEKTWKSMLKRLLSTGDIIPAPSPQLKLTGSLALPRHSNTNDSTDLLAISQSVFRISTRCPITLRVMRQPIRGSDCKHYECFELDSYLLVNRGLAPWKCPHCNNTSTPEKLIYDTFLEKMFATLPSNAAAIEFRKDETAEDGFSRKVIYDKVMDEPLIHPAKNAQDINKQTLNTNGSKQPSFTIVEIDD
ncbi:hypothetical protein NQZ79_g4528 [Umbelopsis isabellina]|nr:hypothetical protein NQZ79_g4528 [Umbelopsis isabellina]